LNWVRRWKFEGAVKLESLGVFRSVLVALVACSVATLAVAPFRGVLLDANLALYYLLVVVWLTVKAGRSAGFAGSVLAVLFFDVFLVPPYDSLTVHDPQHVLTFAMLLAVALATSRLVGRLRTQTMLAETREQLSESLRAMGDALLSAQDADGVRRIGEQVVGNMFDAKAWILPPDFASGGAADPRLTVGMRKIAGAMLRQGAGAAQAPVSSAGVVYFPLQARERISGIMLLALSGRIARLDEMQERWLRTASVQLALALDRVHSIDVAAKARLAEKNERFRNSILSSISHDIRTPLTTVVGLAQQLALEQAHQQAHRQAHQQAHQQAHHGAGAETAARLHRAALRMDATVTNLLDIARFSQNGIAINADWASIDELIGSAIQGQRGEAGRIAIVSEVRGVMALVKLDALLVEKVLCNLIDNALRHARGATRIAVRARFAGKVLRVGVMDDGCGIAHGVQVANVLAPDGERPRDHGGLGLSICRAICDAHGGRLRIFARPGKGCCAMFTIPMTESMPLDYAD
jgi:K+-sensing histidine kinase KdpD